MGNAPLQEKNYPSVCFQYIHHMPVHGKLVENPEDWEFSSYRDYFSDREGTLVNRGLANELGLLESIEMAVPITLNHGISANRPSH
jgi:putative transposase